MSDRWATFDCYGTLIDWHGGLRAGLRTVWPDGDPWTLHMRYLEMEAAIQAGSGVPYRQVLIEGLARVAEAEGLAIPPGRETTLADALPSWQPFPEVAAALAELRARGWRLAILSNTDPDLLAASLEQIGVPVDERITAAEAGSYKPARGHWLRFFERTNADRSRHVHVAASPFHDLAAARELGLRAVWINRIAEQSAEPRVAELVDCAALPETLERLVPA